VQLLLASGPAPGTVECVTSNDAHSDDPGLTWLATRLRWERTLESLQLHSSAYRPRLEQERPAA
jgi:hypothetical protein